MTNIIPNKQRRTPKTPNKQKHTNKKNTNREDNKSKECRHKRQVGPKDGSCPSAKQQNNNNNNNNNEEETNESLTPLNTFQQHPTRTCSVDERHPPPNEKETLIFLKGHYRKAPRKANKMRYLLFPFFLFKCALGPGEKKKHKMRKRRNKEKKDTTSGAIKRDRRQEEGKKRKNK